MEGLVQILLENSRAGMLLKTLQIAEAHLSLRVFFL